MHTTIYRWLRAARRGGEKALQARKSPMSQESNPGTDRWLKFAVVSLILLACANLLSRRMVDHDAQAVRQQLVFLHQLEAANPELIIVPAHDARVHEEIAK